MGGVDFGAPGKTNRTPPVRDTNENLMEVAWKRSNKCAKSIITLFCKYASIHKPNTNPHNKSHLNL